jgi:4-azaleucine resistance transporter AzlC
MAVAVSAILRQMEIKGQSRNNPRSPSGLRAIVGQGLAAALPIMAGYLVLGIPCGILGGQAGMSLLQVACISLLFYSGAGQYMIPNMWLSGAPLLSIVASVSLVNTRQVLYGASLSRFCQQADRRLALLFAATVTDESFGVNLGRFEAGGQWDVPRATAVNLFSLASWTAANCIGVVAGALFAVPVALASFAMTSIFICLLFMQRLSLSSVVAALVAALVVAACKLTGLSEPAIIVGALGGIAAAMLVSRARRGDGGDAGVVGGSGRKGADFAGGVGGNGREGRGEGSAGAGHGASAGSGGDGAGNGVVGSCGLGGRSDR